ncbi:hypothetical protein BGX33_003545 [Mortierella sp. NVP41]|nr:hypothetical protein BGX33_003545 [Mortierella sp. NVP41]
MYTINGATGSSTRKLAAFRSLQPRSAAALDFNDSDGDNESALLSADYKAQRKTTQDLVDFFKNAPPPSPPPPVLPPITVDEKKKRSLLQRLRSRKSGNSVSSLNGGSNSRRSVLVAPSSASEAGSTVSAVSGRGSTVATLPNGRKYVMIAVDYKDTTATSNSSTNGTTATIGAGGASTVTGTTTPTTPLPSALTAKRGSPKRHSKNYPAADDDSGPKHESILSSTPNIKVTTAIDNDDNYRTPDDNNNSTTAVGLGGRDKRRSIIIQAGGGEGSTFILENTPFLLDNFALDTDFIMPSALGADSRSSAGSLSAEGGRQYHRTQSQKSGHSQDGGGGGGSRRGVNKVTFNIAGQPQAPVDEETVSKALVERIANHKAQLAKNQGLLADAAAVDSANESSSLTFQPSEITLPKPVSRKKVRHVQIQTQHCIMRPMYTQTEPIESLAKDLKVKEFSTQTEGTSEMGTSTEIDAAETASVATSTATTAVGSTVNGGAARASSKVASLVASISQPTTPTNTKGTTTTSTTSTTTSDARSTPLTTQDQEELLQLRQKNAVLQAEVSSLQRDLASEMRARTRTAVAMQDTRDKFEMLSAIAYKKIKEMIFQRHVLEMEVRELRAQVDMRAAEDATVSVGTVSGGGGVGQQQQQGYVY